MASLSVLCRTTPAATNGMMAVFILCAGARRAIVQRDILESARIHHREWTAALDRLQDEPLQIPSPDLEAPSHWAVLQAEVRETVAKANAAADEFLMQGIIHDPFGPPPVPTTTAPPRLSLDLEFSVVEPVGVHAGDWLTFDVWCEVNKGTWADSWDQSCWHWSADDIFTDQFVDDRPVDTVMSASVSVPGFTASEAGGTMRWKQRSGVARLTLRPSPQVLAGAQVGQVNVSVGGVSVACIQFMLTLAGETGRDAVRVLSVEQIGSALISFAPEDGDLVLRRLQGLQEVLPLIDVFPDTLGDHNGEVSQQGLDDELARCDRLLLFWSRAASQSRQVEAQWRRALAMRGRAFIQLVHVDPAALAPAPEELST